MVVTLCVSACEVEQIPVSKLNEASVFLVANPMKGFPRVCSLSDSFTAAELSSESQTSLKCWMLWDVEEATGLWGMGMQH